MIGKGWVAAGDLEVGDEVYNLDGTTSVVIGSEVEKLDEPVFVYNLEVEELHSYFVGCVPVLVHNTCKYDKYADYDDYDEDSYLSNRDKTRQNHDSGEKGNTFRGGSKSQRDKWYGYNDREFQKWWERAGKKDFGGQDIQDKSMADEVYRYWTDLGKPSKM